MRVIPYSYTPPAAAIAGLEAVVGRAFGGSSAMTITPPVAYGAEDAHAGVAKLGAATTLVALFSASATPEREVHGEFLSALARQRRAPRRCWRWSMKAPGSRAGGRSPRALRIGARRGGSSPRMRRYPSCSLIYRRRISRLPSRRSTPQSPVVHRECGVNPDSTIALSLIAHTNVGKTTLARTLVGRDVGSVRDAQHVTQEATSYPLLTTAEGDTLVVWDTPGFGDSARLARRLSSKAIRSAGFSRRSGTASAIARSFFRSRSSATFAIRPMSCSISSTRRSRPRTPATSHRSSPSSSGSENRWSC